jgi:hypothetical protein
MDVQSRVLKNVADGVADGDAVNKGQLGIEYPKIETVADNMTTVTSVSNSIASVNTTAGSIANVNTVATNITKVNTVSADIAKVIKVADDLLETVSEIETVADDLNETSSEIEVVANAIANVDIVGGAISSVNATGGNIANVNTVATNITNINAVNTNEANINAVNTNQTNINAVQANEANINTVATNNANVTAVAGKATEIALLGTTDAISDMNTLAVSTVLSDIGTLADVQDGTVYSNAISKVAALSNSLFGLFDNAVLREIYAIVGSTPTLDVDLKNFLTSTHSDGNPVGDLSGDGSITVAESLDVSRIISGIASAAEVTAYEARIKTPAQAVTALYDRYFNTSIVTAPLLTVAANILDIREAATLFASGTLPIAVFSQYSAFATGNGNGLVPAPTASDIANNYVLRADGTWVAP